MNDDLGAAWMDHMRRGEWALAWRVSDAVLSARIGVRQWHLPRHLQAVWDGTSLTGRRVLLRCYHGLGDTIQFIRYAPLVDASELTVWAQPSLIPLLRTLPGARRLLPLHDGSPDVDYDVDVEVMELPYVFRSETDTLPNAVPYLFPPKTKSVARGRDLAVGLVWRSGDWAFEHRSIPFRLLAPLGAIPGVTLHILQRGKALAERPPDFGILSGSDDILQAATIMTGLDLVISIDSMPAHLAGALGLPVWTLLASEADWRWMEAREDSPWYPTMRLYRQPSPGAWDAVITRVAAELGNLAAARLSIDGTRSVGSTRCAVPRPHSAGSG